MSPQEDQRIFDRFCAEFPVRFQNSRREFGSEILLKDISAQGARLQTREYLRINDHVSVQVKLPDGHTQLSLNGEVVWTQRKTLDSWEIGVKFDRINLMSLQRLFKFCC